VAVVDVLPGSINTPLFEHARSKLGTRPRPIPPVYEPRVVAEAIVAAARRPVREVYVGLGGRAWAAAQRVSPALVDRYLLGPGHVMDSQRTDRPDGGRDNLYQPSTGLGSTTGGFGRASKSASPYTRWFGLHPVRARLAGGVVLAAGLAALRRAGRRR
jgi:hypothetical protein